MSLFNNDIGILVAPPAAASNKVKVSNTLIATSTTAGIRLTGPLAGGYISNVVVVGAAKALDIQGGAIMSSYGNNVLDGPTDAPTPTPLQ